MKSIKFLLVAALLALGAAPTLAAVNAQTGTTYTFVNTDCGPVAGGGNVTTFSNAAAVAVTLPQAGTSGAFFPPCQIIAINKGAGTVTITPTTSTIGGASTLVLTTGQSAAIFSDGTNYQVAPGGGGQVSFGASKCTVTGASPQICNGQRGVVTSGTLTTAALTAATYTITNSTVTTGSVVLCNLGAYSGTIVTNGVPQVTQCTPGSGSFIATFYNAHATNALNGTLVFEFAVLN